MKFVSYECANEQLQTQAFELYVNSFPAYERRSLSSHLSALTDDEFEARIVVSEHGGLMAILFYWQHEQMIYVEHIAVNPVLRGQNIGSSVLSEFVTENSNAVIILEIDPPVDEVSIRRLRFYSHLGFMSNDYHYMHPSYTIGGHAHHLVILSHGRTISQAEYDVFVEYMKTRVTFYID